MRYVIPPFFFVAALVTLPAAAISPASPTCWFCLGGSCAESQSGWYPCSSDGRSCMLGSECDIVRPTAAAQSAVSPEAPFASEWKLEAVAIYSGQSPLKTEKQLIPQSSRQRK